jgi:16S rRNA (cytosine967-C5)-methyltransferase
MVTRMVRKAAMAGNDPFADPRRVALAALGATLGRRQTLDETLALDGLKEPRDRAFATLLTATALRRKGQLDAILTRCLDKPPRPDIVNLLRLGATQLLFLATPPHAAVDSAVTLAKQIGLAAFAPLVNAVLRRVADQGAGWLAAQDAALLNTPPWLWQSWCDAYGEATTRAIASSHLRAPPLDLTTAGPPEAWVGRLDAALLFNGSLRRPNGAVTLLPGFAEGGWWVQDVAASLPARLLAPAPGERIADLCAAPGGKTAQLAAAGANVTALDRSPRRLTILADNLRRLSLPARVIEADVEIWRPDIPFDKVLLDAPCSATGTLRRNPDLAWIKRPGDIPKLTAAQDWLLTAAADMVRPGGLLLFCTCSLQPEEGPARILSFLARRPDFVRQPIAASELAGQASLVDPSGDLRTLPCHLAEIGGMDGFYAARVRRQING